MKIWLPFKVTKTGGTSSFVKKFKTGFEDRGNFVSTTVAEPQDFDVLLVVAQCHWRHILRAIAQHKPIIHRLDGVYYPSTVAGWRYPLYNLPLRLIRNYAASFIIYQSRFSQTTCDYFLGGKTATSSQVIYNGVDTDLFTPKGSTHVFEQRTRGPVFITWSQFRRLDQIIPLLQSVERYRSLFHSEAHLVVIGDFVGAAADIPQRYAQLPYVSFMGSMANQEIATYARGADVFVLTHQNPPCPNNVLEAMACGLPICGVADGAMAELTVQQENSQLIDAPGTGYWRPRQLDINQFARNLHTIMSTQQAYTEASRRISLERFTLSTMIDRYAEALQAAVALS